MCERTVLDGLRRLFIRVTLEEPCNPLNFKFTYTACGSCQMNSIMSSTQIVPKFLVSWPVCTNQQFWWELTLRGLRKRSPDSKLKLRCLIGQDRINAMSSPLNQ